MIKLWNELLNGIILKRDEIIIYD